MRVAAHRPLVVCSARCFATTAPLERSRVRRAHTFDVPDFGYGKDPSNPTRDGDVTRRAFSYLVLAAAGATYAAAAKVVVRDLVDTMNASADVLAMANIEVNVADIPEGKGVTVKWRGKPLFIRHRAPKEIEEANAVALSELRDPQPDAARHKEGKPEWLILLGVCTHLGCVPLPDSGDYGAWFCPCHGSHYDTSGRIRKGPAPRNLEVPPYVFLDEDNVLIGLNEVPKKD